MIIIELSKKNSIANNDAYDENMIHEYTGYELIGSATKYISVPFSIIEDKELDNKALGAILYLKAHCGMNDMIGFTIPDMVEWCGFKPNKRAGKINDKFFEILECLFDRGYITFITEKSKSGYMKCMINTEHYNKQCENKYVVIYLDEIEKIMKYEKSNKNDNTITSTTILSVFAYLRYKIPRRPNYLEPEERTINEMLKRRERFPEAYDDTITNIANQIGISNKTLSNVIDILEEDLEFIVTDKAYRVKNENGEYRTPNTIFANAYKRENEFLLAYGKEYSRNEIELKVCKIQAFYPDYMIDESKRK